MQPKFLLTFLAAPSRGRSHLARGRNHAESGFSMVALIFVVLAVVLGSLAFANRSTSGLLGSLFQSQSREAREAAESGITEIISEFNREENRRMLVSGLAPSEWRRDRPDLVNPCRLASDATGTPLETRPTVKAISFNNPAGRQVENAPNRRYVLRNIQFVSFQPSSYTTRQSSPPTGGYDLASATNTSSTFSESNIDLRGTSGTNRTNYGYLRLTVEGQVVNGAGTPVATADITREFQVVPKCCKRSFGPTFSDDGQVANLTENGQDVRDGTGACRGNEEGSGKGFIVGISNGGIDTKGQALELTDSSGNPLNTILWLKDGATCTVTKDCQVTTKDGTTSLVPFQTDLPPLPDEPAGLTTSGCINNQSVVLPKDGLTATVDINSDGILDAVGACPSNKKVIQEVDQEVSKVKGKCVSPAVEIKNKCYVKTTKEVDITAYEPYCLAVPGEAVYCKIRYVSLQGNDNIVVDSGASSGELPVRLLFYDETDTTNPSVSGGDVEMGGNNSLFHVKCPGTVPPTDPVTAAACPRRDDTDPNDPGSSYLGMYGNVVGQVIDLGGTNGILSAFLYFPVGTLDIGGGGGGLNIQGIVWVNNVELNGSVSITTPPTSVINKVTGNLPGFQPNVWDWVARSVRSTSLFRSQ